MLPTFKNLDVLHKNPDLWLLLKATSDDDGLRPVLSPVTCLASTVASSGCSVGPMQDPCHVLNNVSQISMCTQTLTVWCNE